MRSGYFVGLAAALLLAGCGDNNNQRGGAAPPTTSAVANSAATSTESGEPFPINDGAFAFNDTSDVRDPRAINR